MTYTENQVQEIIRSKLDLQEELDRTKRDLDKEAGKYKSLYDLYVGMCERCLTVHVSKEEFNDSLRVNILVPKFMSQTDFETGLHNLLLKQCLHERELLLSKSR